jgi:hypothetical protein
MVASKERKADGGREGRREREREREGYSNLLPPIGSPS